MATKTKMHDIPKYWTQMKLSEIGSAIIGLTYSPTDVAEDGGIIVLRSSNVQDSKIKYSDIVRVSNSVPEKLMVKKGDILICARNGSKRLIGKNALISKEDEGNAFGAFMSVFRTEDYRYTYQLFQSDGFKKEIARDLGPTINQVTTGNLLRFKFNFPDSDEKNRIVKVLETWDEAIEKLDRVIELKKDVKKGLMQKLLTGDLRLPGFNAEWKKGKVKDFFTVTRGDVLAVNLMSQVRNDEYKYPVYSSQTKKNGLTGFYTDHLYEDAVTWTTDGANAGDVKFRSGKFYCTNVCGVLLSDKGYANHFVAACLNAVSHRYVSYVGNPKLMNNVMSEIQITIPDADEQRAISKFITLADKEIDCLIGKRNKILDQKKYLLNNLVTGRIRTPENL